MEITEFLLREIGVDEAVVSSGDSTRHLPADIVGAFNPHCPACLAGWPGRDRFLAECVAKREIIEAADAMADRGWGGQQEGERIMQYLALPYADRKGWREEWRP